MGIRDLDRWLRQQRDRVERIEFPEAIEETFGQYRHDPVGFCREVLGVESATRLSDGELYQFTILQDVADHPRVVVKSGHGVGKSAVNAWAALWWLLTRSMSRVIIVAPEFSRQVRAVLFAEIRKWARRATVPLPVTVMAHRAIVEGYGEEWSALGLPATEPDRIEGLHSEAGVLLILDETKGISQGVYDALQGALTGLKENRLLVTSTPGGPSGPFYRIWAKGGERWVHHHVPGTDSSIVHSQWCEDRAREWGIGSPLYQARVLGEFPDAGEGVLFPLSLLEDATQRELEIPENARVTLGVDVARSIAGDLNCIAVSRGGNLERVITWRSADTMATVQRVVQEAAMYGAKRVVVDTTGIGAGVTDRLRQLGYEVDAVMFGGKASDAQRFRNIRSEMFWRLRELLERGKVALNVEDAEELIADLSALTYSFTQDGKIALDSKDEVRKRLGRSPDRGDAVALASGTSSYQFDDDALAGFVEANADFMQVSPWKIY